MDKLVAPDPGLMIWTVVTFLALAVILKRYAWGPLLKAIAEREARLKADAAAAEAARAEAQRIKDELLERLAGVEARRQEVLAQASREGETVLSRFKAAAQKESQELRDKTLSELSREKERLVRELRRETAELSVLVAEKLLRRSVDPAVEKSVLDEFLRDIEARGSR